MGTRNGSTLAALCAAVALTGALRSSATEQLVDGIAAQVGTRIVLVSEVLRTVGAQEEAMRRAGAGDEDVAKLRAEALERLIEARLVESVVARLEVTASDEEVDATIRQIAQMNGGVVCQLAGYSLVANQGTIIGTGFPPASSPTAIVIRANNQEGTPVAFGDGLRCAGTVNLVRLAATVASGGSSVHAFGHNPALPPATFYYQIWFRNTPATAPCSAAPAAFNLSNGRAIFWP